MWYVDGCREYRVFETHGYVYGCLTYMRRENRKKKAGNASGATVAAPWPNLHYGYRAWTGSCQVKPGRPSPVECLTVLAGRQGESRTASAKWKRSHHEVHEEHEGTAEIRSFFVTFLVKHCLHPTGWPRARLVRPSTVTRPHRIIAPLVLVNGPLMDRSI